MAVGVGGFDDDVLLDLLEGLSRVMHSIGTYRGKAYTTNIHKARSSGYSLSGVGMLTQED